VDPSNGIPVDVLPAGEEAVLVEVADLDDVLALGAALRSMAASAGGPWGAVTDLVPGARTLLVVAGPRTDLVALSRSVREVAARADRSADPGAGRASVPVVEVPVRYDGPDLGDVAALTGLTVSEVVAAHTRTPWRVAFGGFAPGFAYLVGGDARLRVPRRDTPRVSVPAGSVALAGGFSAVYPRPSPGGWQLIGTSGAVLWDVGRQPPALLTPGAAVRFVDVGSGS
jgi:KipI family sensor histidine kinase inhibitor